MSTRHETFVASLIWLASLMPVLAGCVADDRRRAADTLTAETVGDTAHDTGDLIADTAPDLDTDDGSTLRPYPPSTNPGVITLRAVEVADLDGDGLDDLVVTNALETAARGLFVFRGRAGFDVDAFDFYLKNDARGLDVAAVTADGDDRLDLVTIGLDRGGSGLLEVHLARGASLSFATPLVHQFSEEGFPEGGDTLPDAPPVRLITRDVTRDGVVDFVVADTTRVVFVSPAGFAPEAFSSRTVTPLDTGSALAGLVDVHFVAARGTIDDRVVIVERERLTAFDAPFTAGTPPSPIALGPLPFGAEAAIGSATADVDGDGLRDVIVFAGHQLHAVTLTSPPGISSMHVDTLVTDTRFDAIWVGDVNGNSAPDVILLDADRQPRIGSSGVVLVVDLRVTDGALTSPFAPVRQKLEPELDPELLAVGDFDGVTDDLEVVTFDVAGGAQCLHLNRATFAFSACGLATP